MSSNRCSCWVFHVLAERVTTPDCSESLYMFTWMRAFSPLQTGRLVPARDRCVGRFDVEIAQNAVPVGLCAVGPGMRALDFGWYGAGGIVNAYLYMVAAGCQGRQAIAVRCIDMSQRADAVPVYPESTGLCTFHEEYQAFPFHLYGNFNIFSYSTMPE